MDEIEALTVELRAVREMLERVATRLDEADERAEDAERRARHHRLWTWMLAVSLLGVAALGYAFVKEGNAERQRICRGIHAVAESLVDATSDGERTPAEQAAYEETVRQYRAGIDARMGRCG